jgi:4-hydroxy-tetrahydrodipicolinate synthase
MTTHPSGDRFGGVHTIMPTPFTDAGALDLKSLERLTEFLIGRGVDGLVVLGVMGEAPKLTQEERDEVLATTVSAASGRVPVYAGAGGAGTDMAIARGRRAVELGAAGLLVAPPPVQNDAVIREYYRRHDAALDTTIILHDYPAATNIKMAPELVVDMHDAFQTVEVIKLEESPSLPKITKIRDLGSDIGIVGGLGGMFVYEELERGADGIMTGLSYPELLVEIVREHRAGNRERARKVFYDACPLLRYEFQPGIGLALRKEVYRMRGAIASAFVRHPGAQIDAHLRKELVEAIHACGLETGVAA